MSAPQISVLLLKNWVYQNFCHLYFLLSSATETHHSVVLSASLRTQRKRLQRVVNVLNVLLPEKSYGSRRWQQPSHPIPFLTQCPLAGATSPSRPEQPDSEIASYKPPMHWAHNKTNTNPKHFWLYWTYKMCALLLFALQTVLLFFKYKLGVAPYNDSKGILFYSILCLTQMWHIIYLTVQLHDMSLSSEKTTSSCLAWKAVPQSQNGLNGKLYYFQLWMETISERHLPDELWSMCSHSHIQTQAIHTYTRARTHTRLPALAYFQSHAGGFNIR